MRHTPANILRGIVSAVALSLILTGMISCGGRSGNTKSLDRDTLDLVETDCVPSAKEPDRLLPLPDTMYSSVQRVKYKVDVFDTILDPKINDLADMYRNTPGAFTFRKGQYRQADFGGQIHGKPTDIVVDWVYTTAFRGVWGGGSGWTGQPLYVCWPDSMMRLWRQDTVVAKGFSGKEVMVGSLCGEVCFIDFETGRDSRRPIDVGNPIKGTMSLDPTLNGNLYVGQGVPDQEPFGALVIDLRKHEVTHTFDRDPNAWRGWGAYDSSPLRLGQYLLRPGENGTLYKFYVEPGRLRLQSTLRYRVNGAAPGMEASMSIYRNYGYIADNHGNIICVNLDTMTPVWHYALGDDIDSSIVLVPEGDHPYVYTGCEVDKQCVGMARYVKLDGLTGEQQWLLQLPARQYISEDEKHFDGGFYSTALPGVADCDSLLFVNCVLNDTTVRQNGQFMAVNRHTGRVAYTTPLRRYAWSSPVGMTDDSGEMYVVTGDCVGNIYLIHGRTGRVIVRKAVGANFESSPVVVDNHLVVGSRGQKIYRLSVVSGPTSQEASQSKSTASMTGL